MASVDVELRGATAVISHRNLTELAEGFIACRDRLGAALPDATYGDPASRIILPLYVAAARGKDVTIGDLAVLAAVPRTTVIRWLDALEEGGRIRRLEDPADRRRVFVDLLPETQQIVQRWLANVAALLDGPIGDAGAKQAGARPPAALPGL